MEVKNIPLNLFHQICILLSYYTHKLQATYFVIHISINVCSVGYFSHATLPNVVGLCADRISSIIQPFQYKLAMANWGGQYLQRLWESKPIIMQQICTGCMLIPKALDKYGWCNFFTLLIKHLFTINPHMLWLYYQSHHQAKALYSYPMNLLYSKYGSRCHVQKFNFCTLWDEIFWMQCPLTYMLTLQIRNFFIFYTGWCWWLD